MPKRSVVHWSCTWFIFGCNCSSGLLGAAPLGLCWRDCCDCLPSPDVETWNPLYWHNVTTVNPSCSRTKTVIETLQIFSWLVCAQLVSYVTTVSAPVCFCRCKSTWTSPRSSALHWTNVKQHRSLFLFFFSSLCLNTDTSSSHRTVCVFGSKFCNEILREGRGERKKNTTQN